jgi:hypothetical protein
MAATVRTCVSGVGGGADGGLRPGARLRACPAARGERLLYPLDACARLRFGARELLRLGRGGRVARHVARHAWRWRAYTPLRYASASFTVWDRVPAPDALGLLRPRIEALRLAQYGRGGVRRAAGGAATVVVRAFEETARERALALLSAG